MNEQTTKKLEALCQNYDKEQLNKIIEKITRKDISEAFSIIVAQDCAPALKPLLDRFNVDIQLSQRGLSSSSVLPSLAEQFLSTACHKGATSVVRLLLNEYDYSSYTRNSALFTACRQGHLQMVQMMVEGTGIKESLDIKHENYECLAQASMMGQLAVVEYLVSKAPVGADLSNPYFWSIRERERGCQAFLEQHLTVETVRNAFYQACSMGIEHVIEYTAPVDKKIMNKGIEIAIKAQRAYLQPIIITCCEQTILNKALESKAPSKISKYKL